MRKDVSLTELFCGVSDPSSDWKKFMVIKKRLD